MAVAVDPKALAAEEMRWYRENPDPQSTPTLEQLSEHDDTLTLWNFPVAKADLGPAHREVLEKFAAPGLIAETPEHPRMDFDVVGHASVTGTEQSNVDYAQQRADTVKEFLEALGIMKVNADSRGSSQPDGEGTSGQALARNRRVTIRRSFSTYRVVPPPPPPQAPTAPGPEASTVQVTVPINLALHPLVAPKVVIAPFIIGDLTVGVRGGDPVKVGVTTSSEGRPALTPEFAKVLVEQVLDPRLGVSGGEGKDPVSINVGVAAERWFTTPKVVYQHGPNFISFNFRAVNASFLPVVPFNGVDVILEFSGSIRFDIGPSAVGTYPSTSDPGPNVTDTAGQFVPVKSEAALVIAATITDAGAKASQLAQDDIKKMVLNLARRDGAACWAAWEALESSDAATIAWRQMRSDWRNRVGRDAETAWMDGNKQVEDMLKALEKAKEGDREKRATEWKTKYGGTATTPDFDFIREAVFQQLKGYDEDQGDLPELIKGL
jgi:outer membrane protein OmpA-like peptidoglycan-associated protein